MERTEQENVFKTVYGASFYFSIDKETVSGIKKKKIASEFIGEQNYSDFAEFFGEQTFPDYSEAVVEKKITLRHWARSTTFGGMFGNSDDETADLLVEMMKRCGIECNKGQDCETLTDTLDFINGKPLWYSIYEYAGGHKIFAPLYFREAVELFDEPPEIFGALPWRHKVKISFHSYELKHIDETYRKAINFLHDFYEYKTVELAMTFALYVQAKLTKKSLRNGKF